MLAHLLLLSPLLHGKWGYWDEIANAALLVLGVGVLVGLYWLARRRRAKPAPPPDADPKS